MSWAAEELRDIDLGDERRNKRAVQLLERLSAQPTASLPNALNGWAETMAAYRFFAQDEVEWTDIMQPHQASSVERMMGHDVVLCIQDTTELDFNGQQIAGLGPLSYEAQRGLYLHPTYAVTVDREPLGVLDVWMWAREFKDADGKRGPEKESARWISGYEHVAKLSEALADTRLVYVADRESDIVALMVKARDLGNPADWLLRCQHDRNLRDGKKLWESVTAGSALGTIAFTLPSRHGQKARLVKQHVWARQVELPAGKAGKVAATCIVAAEFGAPKGIKPVQWRLLTNREASTLEAVVELIDWYRARWEIEMYFHVLKNGCRVEALQLSTIERMQRALALYLVVAWRVARLMRLGRTCPDLDAALFFDSDEWQAAYILAKKPIPKMPPRLNEVVRLVARLGGFLGRKGDGEPGVKTIWIGLQRLMDFAAGLRYAREGMSS
jgi:Transposase Tn5 dimerisation domain/Transposase DNA-binding